MKPMSDMTHYEVLEVAHDATGEAVDRAYKIATATYEEDSLATYSLYEENELDAIRERIEQAYRVLGSNEAREDYDHSLGGGAPAPERGRVEIQLDFENISELAPSEVAPEIEEFADLEDPQDGAFDGARLRRTRLARGVDIDRIAQVTKINPTYLRYIEEEQFGDLPADVYVRGFVAAYARCVGLDPERVLPVYMERLRSGRRSPSQVGRSQGQRR